MRIGHAVVLGIVLALSGSVDALAADPAVILDQASCLRRYYRFAVDQVSPAALAADGQRVLGTVAFERLQHATEKSLGVSGNDNFAVFRFSPRILRLAREVGTAEAQKNVATTPADWREFVFRRLFFDPYTAPPPADNWAVPEFDDAAWVLGPGPFQVDLPDDLPAEATSGNMANVHVNVLQYLGTGLHSACYRARFRVDDPANVRELTFTATYRGGLCVWINGQELARGHLPRGDLSPDVPADDYPAAAYTNANLRNRSLGPAAIAPKMLRAGVNVLAIEVRASLLHPMVLKTEQSKSWNALHDREGVWRHGFLGSFQLRSADRAVSPANQRLGGLHAWVEDVHRRIRSSDFPPDGQSGGIIRFVGAQNGSYSAQVVLSSDKDVPEVDITAGELKSDAGAVISSAALRIFHTMPYPAAGFSEELGDERGLSARFPTQAQLRQCALMADAQQVYIFDQITPQPQSLRAGMCRPLWLSLRIPADAPAGRYRATLRIQAGTQREILLPIEADVIAWRLPDPREFQTYVGCEQNPYGVAKQYAAPLWSGQHFRLLEASFRQLGRAGGKWLNVPVVRGTEFGNRDDSMIRWTRRKDGSLTYDFAILDKYLDLAVRHLGTPRMINVVVMPGMSSAQNIPAVSEIMVLDEATGKISPLLMGGPGVSLETKKKLWLPFATALHAHLKARGLDKAMHWGYPLDSEVDHDLVVLLGEHLPAVKWNGGPHQIGSWGYKEPKYYDVFGTVRYFNNWPGFSMRCGWKSPQVQLTIPRIDSSVQSLITASHPFGFRTLVNHSLALGRCGFVRVGADEWASIHYEGMRIPTWIVGMPVLFTLWPGADGAESSARFEALIEGIEEGEVRIHLEKALDRGRLPANLARTATEALDRHYLETTFFQNKLCIHELEQYHHGWQERSRELYQAAAAVSAATGPTPMD